MASKSHKRQHWVPKCYLGAWADQNTPVGFTPYVHVFPKEGGESMRRAPAKLFRETDLYTISLPDGRRDLRLEKGLSGLEKDFTEIRKEFLEKRKELPFPRLLKLLAFVAASHVRTPFMRDHHAQQWGRVLELGEKLERSMRNASFEQRKVASLMSIPGNGPSISMEEVRILATQPMQHMLAPMIAGQLQAMVQMSSIVLCTSEDHQYITSDSPVVWVDAEAHKKPAFLRSPGLLSPGIQITIPLSPTQTLLIVHGEPGLRYMNIPSDVVRAVNRLTRNHCYNTFISAKNSVEFSRLQDGSEI